jgi:hypothetical protein
VHDNAVYEMCSIDYRRVNAAAGIAHRFEKVGKKLGFSEFVHGWWKRYSPHLALKAVI